MKRVFGCLFSMAFLVGVLQLEGCAGQPHSGNSSSEKASSQQTGGSDERQRSKTHTELGALYLQSDRLPVALEEARIAVNADSSYAPAHALLALVHMYLGENDSAEESFRRALDIVPNDSEINNSYGWFLCKTKREAASMAYFKTAYKNPLYQAPTRAYMNAGVCAIQIKDYAAAEAYLNSALRYDPSNTLAAYWQAEVYLRTQRYEEARAKMSDLMKMVEPNAELLWLGARIEHAAGDREAELRYSVQLRRRFQTSPEYQKFVKGQYE